MTPKEYAEMHIITMMTLEVKRHEAIKLAKFYCNNIINLVRRMHKPEYSFFDIYEPKQFTLEGEPDHLNGYQVQFFMEEVLQELDKM